MKRIYLSLLNLIVSLNNLYAQRKPLWATPVKAKFVNNLHKIDECVYRAAQPDVEAYKELEELGVKEILSLRYWANNKMGAFETNLKFHHVEMLASKCQWDKIVEALLIIKNRQGPIVIHCKHGADRTGLIAALYRIVFQDWDKEAAIDELENGGYNFNTTYSNILEYIRKIDVPALKSVVMGQNL